MSEAISGKRKSEEQPAGQRKRRRLEELVLGEVPGLEAGRVAERRAKLLGALRMSRRYRYFCSRHNVGYLVEAARAKFETASRRGRDALLEGLRSLSVGEAVAEDEDAGEQEDSGNGDECDIKNEFVDSSEKNSLVQVESPARTSKRKAHPTESDTDEDSDGWTGRARPGPKRLRPGPKTYDLFGQKKAPARRILEDESEPGSGCRGRRQVAQRFIVRKTPGEDNVIFSEGEDYATSDGDEDSCCDCPYHEDLKEKARNYEYGSSSDDDSDTLADLWYGTR